MANENRFVFRRRGKPWNHILRPILLQATPGRNRRPYSDPGLPLLDQSPSTNTLSPRRPLSRPGTYQRYPSLHFFLLSCKQPLTLRHSEIRTRSVELVVEPRVGPGRSRATVPYEHLRCSRYRGDCRYVHFPLLRGRQGPGCGRIGGLFECVIPTIPGLSSKLWSFSRVAESVEWMIVKKIHVNTF